MLEDGPVIGFADAFTEDKRIESGSGWRACNLAESVVEAGACVFIEGPLFELVFWV